MAHLAGREDQRAARAAATAELDRVTQSEPELAEQRACAKAGRGLLAHAAGDFGAARAWLAEARAVMACTEFGPYIQANRVIGTLASRLENEGQT